MYERLNAELNSMLSNDNFAAIFCYCCCCFLEWSLLFSISVMMLSTKFASFSLLFGRRIVWIHFVHIIFFYSCVWFSISSLFARAIQAHTFQHFSICSILLLLRHTAKVCWVSCEFIHENEHAQEKQTNERKKNNNSNNSNEWAARKHLIQDPPAANTKTTTTTKNEIFYPPAPLVPFKWKTHHIPMVHIALLK